MIASLKKIAAKTPWFLLILIFTAINLYLKYPLLSKTLSLYGNHIDPIITYPIIILLLGITFALLGLSPDGWVLSVLAIFNIHLLLTTSELFDSGWCQFNLITISILDFIIMNLGLVIGLIIIKFILNKLFAIHMPLKTTYWTALITILVGVGLCTIMIRGLNLNPIVTSICNAFIFTIG